MAYGEMRAHRCEDSRNRWVIPPVATILLGDLLDGLDAGLAVEDAVAACEPTVNMGDLLDYFDAGGRARDLRF